MGLLDFDKLAADPIVQMGLGILANSTGPRGVGLGASVGRGALQGMENVYQMQNMQNAAAFRKMQMDEMQRQQEQAKAMRDLAQRSVQSPQSQAIGQYGPTPQGAAAIPNMKPQFDTEGFLSGMMGIDPLQAMQMRERMRKKPIKAGLDEVFLDPDTMKPIWQGPGKEAALPWYVRRGPNGQTMIDPAYADFEKAKAASGRPATPFFQFLPTPEGYAVGDARSGRISPASINGKPVIRSQDDPALQGRIAGAKEDATTRAGAEAKRDVTMAGLPSIISEAESILSAKGSAKPTSSVVGAGVDVLGGVVGYSPAGAEQAAKLQALGGALVMKMPRMEGPQSNYDQQLYREMAGDVGNPMKPIKQRIAALETIKKLNSKYMGTSAPSATSSGAKFLGFE